MTSRLRHIRNKIIQAVYAVGHPLISYDDIATIFGLTQSAVCKIVQKSAKPTPETKTNIDEYREWLNNE